MIACRTLMFFMITVTGRAIPFSSLCDAYRTRGKGAFESQELAADGIILDMTFSESRYDHDCVLQNL